MRKLLEVCLEELKDYNTHEFSFPMNFFPQRCWTLLSWIETFVSTVCACVCVKCLCCITWKCSKGNPVSTVQVVYETVTTTVGRFVVSAGVRYMVAGNTSTYIYLCVKFNLFIYCRCICNLEKGFCGFRVF